MPVAWTPALQWWLEVYLESKGNDATRNRLQVAQAAMCHVGVRPTDANVIAARKAVGPVSGLSRARRSIPETEVFWAPRIIGRGKLRRDRRDRIKVLAELRR